MRILHCEFPDEFLYDSEGLVWALPEDSGDVRVGITSIYAALAGRLAKITAKPHGVPFAQGAAIGLLESSKYFGPIRAPIGGVVTGVNETVLREPRTMTDAVYGDGWFARLRPTDLAADRKALQVLPAAKEILSKQIEALRVRCFAAFPDYEMFEIGLECSAVLAKLNELLMHIETGEVVHLVTDDPTSPIEMVRWSDQTHQPVIDERREGTLYHFLVRKVA